MSDLSDANLMHAAREGRLKQGAETEGVCRELLEARATIARLEAELAKYREDEADLARCAKKVDAWAAEHGGMLEAVKAGIADEDAARVAQARREACEAVAVAIDEVFANAPYETEEEWERKMRAVADFARRIGEGR